MKREMSLIDFARHLGIPLEALIRAIERRAFTAANGLIARDPLPVIDLRVSEAHRRQILAEALHHRNSPREHIRAA